MTRQNQYTTRNRTSVASHLFAYHRTHETAATAGEISRALGIPISTVHKMLQPGNRPVGIVESNQKEQGNTKPAKRYWYDANAVATATKEYEKAKQLPKAEDITVMPIPNNDLYAVTLIDVIAPLNPQMRNNFEIIMSEEATFKDLIVELHERMNDPEMEDERKRLNAILLGVAIAQKAINSA